MRKDLVEKVARWIRRRDYYNGVLTDEYTPFARYWRDEAKKLIKVFERNS